MLVYSLRMPEQCQPTSKDIENAAIRAAIADKQNAASREVMAWADKIMGLEAPRITLLFRVGESIPDSRRSLRDLSGTRQTRSSKRAFHGTFSAIA
ncbi:MAG TPA: hypothetical protein VN688_27940 [Gemmataceae bacterium]|nr:hypothetical protein [Gemmataceae bacterium]